jgi:transcriptional regulator with XRE-family HTH domain
MYDLALILQTFGAKVRARRQAKGLSQMDLATAAGLHRTYIADVECGRRNSSMGSIAKIAKALEISISDLCRGIECLSTPKGLRNNAGLATKELPRVKSSEP